VRRTREFFVVVEGELRFTIEGQPQPSSDAGPVVNIPKVAYSAEVIGALRLVGRCEPGEFQDAHAGDRSKPAQTQGTR
jgi:hypothetical protein